MDQELLQITATNVIFDLFLMYGLEAFNIDQNKNDETAADKEDGENLETFELMTNVNSVRK